MADTLANAQTSYTIESAAFPLDLAVTKTLFAAYAAALPVDISYQNFDQELSTLPGRYGAGAGGAVLLARDAATGEPVGCAALRSLDGLLPGARLDTGTMIASPSAEAAPQGRRSSRRTCELKRLYVMPTLRGSGLGRRLLLAMLELARDQGYDDMYLDTLRSMTGPIRLYESAGFEETAAYNKGPLDCKYFTKRLR